MKSRNLLFRLFAIILPFVSSASGQQVTVTINVLPPRSTPDGSHLYVTGNHPHAGDWNPGAIELQKKSDSLWTVSLTIPKYFIFEFKITRGAWNRQAMFRENEIPQNTQVTVVSDTVLNIRPLSWSDSVYVTRGGVVGTVKYHLKLTAEGLSYPRDIIVWLPPSYSKDSVTRYPVLYMHDGQNIIDPKTSFIGYDWRVDEVADSLIREGKLRDIIVVGIYNTPDRLEEYSHSIKGRAYMRFVVEKLKPMIDATYRTVSDREHTAVMGSSMGGLVSFLMVWNFPEIFSLAGCVSPVFKNELIRSVKRFRGQDKKVRIYIDNGGVGPERSLLQGCEKMLKTLQGKGFILGQNLGWYFDERADHSERSWSNRLWRPLTFMYGKK